MPHSSDGNPAPESGSGDGRRVDRRVQRTREGLHHALLDLILEKRYDKITVQDIIDRANVGRSTFYAHFLDKEDLLEQGLRQIGQQLHQSMAERSDDGPEGGGEADSILNSHVFFVHAYANRDLYRAMISGGGGDFLLDTGRKHFTAGLEAHLSQRAASGGKQEIPTAVVARYLAGAMMSILTWWLAEDMPYPPETINAMYESLARPSLEALR